MPRRIHLHPHLTDQELHERYRLAYDPVKRSRWQFLWMLAGGLTATVIAKVTGYSAYWIGQIARRYNQAGPDGVRDLRHHVLARQPLLTEEQHAALRTALAEPHPTGDHWCGRTVARWISMAERAAGSARESSSRVACLTTIGRTLPPATPAPCAG
jgi:hypothetical protein